MSAPVLVLREESSLYQDRDRLWKEIITEMFEPFILFSMPSLYEKLDWNRKPEMLEQELHRLSVQKKGKRETDKLVKVFLKNGKEQWILVHIEIQGSPDTDFSYRMFQYFYRILDKYKQKIVAIALLTDDRKSFKPQSFHYDFYGTQLTYSYNTFKLMEMDEQQLQRSQNPSSVSCFIKLKRGTIINKQVKNF
ncbi:hypothetical protein JOD43_001198 [Pullulanibacillus pueri]|uniref:Transposase (putative) YhgA-like domain-containing protein n=1 Tax=Pullulanibacillus pueri TaxID=1437324 RepID=A0A8J3EKW2_9BACL|nr:Rpn family recombination-promoting nuclease/putative transposase [Pullulanibacillus pueri]MBM7681031.1 hypothetical protein [Pullulanibacillus pueri]GGH76773.1 hypothetical protein GCM10007096_07680 [Pullulanibacillus pueri]